MTIRHRGAAVMSGAAPPGSPAPPTTTPTRAGTPDEPEVPLDQALTSHGHVALLRGAGPLPRALLIATTTTACYPLSTSPPPPRCLLDAGFTPVTSLAPAVLDQLTPVPAWHAQGERHRASIQIRSRRAEILSEVLLHVPPDWWTAITVHHTLTLVVVNQVALAHVDGGHGLAVALRRGQLWPGHVLAGHIATNLRPAPATTPAPDARPRRSG